MSLSISLFFLFSLFPTFSSFLEVAARLGELDRRKEIERLSAVYERQREVRA